MSSIFLKFIFYFSNAKSRKCKFHLSVGILVTHVNTKKVTKSGTCRVLCIFIDIYFMHLSFNTTYILYGSDQGRKSWLLRLSKQWYSRLTELHQVLISGVGGQASDVEVRLAQLIPSWVATTATVVITAGGAGTGRGHGVRWDQRLLQNKNQGVSEQK